MTYYCLVEKQGKLFQSKSLNHEDSNTKIRPPIITCKKSWSDFDLTQPKVNHRFLTSDSRVYSETNLHKYVSLCKFKISFLFTMYSDTCLNRTLKK